MLDEERDEIFEKRHSQKFGYANFKDLMTERQFERGQYYRQKYLQRMGEMGEDRSHFERLMKLYACERDPVANDPFYPNNFIPIITPAVEGQTASMMEGGIEYIYLSNNPSQQKYLPKLEAAGAYCRRLNNAENHYKDFTRYYEILGNSWMTVMWEKSYSNAKNKPSGYPRIMIPPIHSVLVDGRIKDFKDLQHAEYIIHAIGFQDIAWARSEYGDEKADAISAYLNIYDGSDVDISFDDTNTFTLLHVWTRDNEYGNLQLIEMDSSGFILRESDPEEPYYKTVDNEYPFYFARMMPRMGKFYGYGDGKILEYMQNFLNNLADELELAVRFSSQTRTYVDSKANMNVDQLDSDPSHVIPCDNPRQNVYTVPAMGINNVVLQTMQMVLEQAQRSIRLSDIMNGTQQGVSATATQINGQISQGSVGIRDKAADIQRAMAWCDRYCVRLCLEKWDIPFWVGKFRSSMDSDGSEFLDMQTLSKVPAVVEMSGIESEKRRESKKKNPNIKTVNWQTVYEKDEDGNETDQPVYVDLDYNVEVKLSSGFPRGKNDLFNQMISLSQLTILNADTGAAESIADVNVIRAKLEEILGFKLASKKQSTTSNQQFAQTNNANPIGTSGEVTQPQGSQVRTQPSNLMSTVPLTKDSRGMQ